MIPAHFLHHNKKDKPNDDDGNPTKVVTLTIKQPEPGLGDDIKFPETPNTLGKVTETITKSTFTETVVTRVTDNKLVQPVIIEVSILICFILFNFVLFVFIYECILINNNLIYFSSFHFMFNCNENHIAVGFFN